MIDTAQLELIRQLLHQFPQLAETIGSIQTFKIVIDVNMVARELKRRFQSFGEPTITEQLAEIGILEIYFPRWGEIELEERGAFLRISRNMNVRERDLRQQWEEYRDCLIVDGDSSEIEEEFDGVFDRYDSPYAVTQRRVGALGILSADKKAFDEAQIRRLSREHVEMIEAYVSASSDLLGIRLAASLGGALSVTALLETVKALGRLWQSSPNWVRVLLTIAGSAAIATPSLRARLLDGVKTAGAFSWEVGTALIEVHEDRQRLSNQALTSIQAENAE